MKLYDFMYNTETKEIAMKAVEATETEKQFRVTDKKNPVLGGRIHVNKEKLDSICKPEDSPCRYMISREDNMELFTRLLREDEAATNQRIREELAKSDAIKADLETL